MPETILTASDSPSTTVQDLYADLTAAGVEVVGGWATNASNLVHAKTMPISRLESFVRSGAGMSPVHHGYSLDGSIQFTPYISAVGDLRMRLVPEAVRIIGDGIAIAPTTVVNQDGSPDPAGPRHILQEAVRACREAGLEPSVGYELEFTLVAPDGSALEPPVWTPYGLSALLDHQQFFVDLAQAAKRAGIEILQTHAEFGTCQMEVSLPPASPVEAADTMLVVKAIIGRVARAHGMLPSFSPAPFAGAVGNGAHQHYALSRDGEPVFSGGTGEHGIRTEGGQAIAGIIDGLPDIQALLTGSILSGSRLIPGMWAGAYDVWGVENREAAVRFILGGESNPSGANVEVKIIDPSANPYASAAAVIALMLRGIEQRLPLPQEATEIPGEMQEAERERRGYRLLASRQEQILHALEHGSAAELVGEPFVLATLAVRRHEAEVFGGLSAEDLAKRLRLSWTL